LVLRRLEVRGREAQGPRLVDRHRRQDGARARRGPHALPARAARRGRRVVRARLAALDRRRPGREPPAHRGRAPAAAPRRAGRPRRLRRARGPALRLTEGNDPHMSELSLILPLKRAVPYIRLYKGKTFVVKVGGNVLKDQKALSNFCEDVALLVQLGIKVAIVHGGGPQATELSKKLGHEPVFVAGRRVTDDQTLEIAKMVYAGKLNLELLAALEAKGVAGIGL